MLDGSRCVLSRLALKIVVGAREQGTGNRKRVLGDLTFLHIPLYFSAHLLSQGEAFGQSIIHFF
ncbi:hypothetical protein FJR38_06890 [Anabaena sp. UHCC 0253]|nr:hypothetical protein [Anabaena sp. UHCC 0253]